MKSESFYEIKQKISMSQKIVAKDHDYGDYSGADLETAMKISKIKTLIEAGIIKPSPLINLALTMLNQKRKAFFGSTSTELTKLGFILGDERVRKSASNPTT